MINWRPRAAAHSDATADDAFCNEGGSCATRRFIAEGEFWKKDRRIVAPHLNHKNVNDYMKFVQIVTKRLMHKFESGRKI